MTEVVHAQQSGDLDLGESVELSYGTWWVGSGGKSFLSRNAYFRRFEGGGKTVNLLIDPGPPVDFDLLTAKLTPIAGGMAKINMIFANHQDPDVVGCLPYMSNLNSQCCFLATEETWRLISHFGLDYKNFRAVERFSHGRAMLPSGHSLQFVPTPFCHFRGAVMLYDPETRILFSGDLLGGIAAPGLFATAANWTGIKAFHQLYMPCNDALRLAVERIRNLDPAPLMIAPQHGGIIQGDLIGMFLDRMGDLRVGVDLIVSLQEKLPLLIEAINQILDSGRKVLGDERMTEVMNMFRSNGTYPAFLTLTRADKVQEIRGEPFETTEAMLKVIYRILDDREKNLLTPLILKILVDRHLPPFDLLMQAEAGPEFELLDLDEV